MKRACLILFVLVMVACSKDDPSALSGILSRHTSGWMMTSAIVTINGVDKDVFNDPAYIPDCDKDDVSVFLSDGTYQLVSTVKCNASEPDVLETGTWSVSENDTRLTITVANSINTGAVYYADETHVKTSKLLQVNGASVAAEVTLVPK